MNFATVVEVRGDRLSGKRGDLRAVRPNSDISVESRGPIPKLSCIKAIKGDTTTIRAVFHGPTGLVNIKLADGNYLIAEKTVAGFTNDAEVAVGRQDIVPFLLESKLCDVPVGMG